MKNLKKEIIIIPAKNTKITELFNKNKKGKDKQWHSFDFKEFLKSINSIIKTPEIKIQKYKLTERKNDFQIKDILGGKEKLVHKTKAFALVTLSQTMTDDEYRDGKANIVYYLDEDSELCYTYCFWSALWRCNMNLANAKVWNIGSRVFFPAT